MGFKGITITTSEESLGNITAADDAAIFQSLIGSDGVLNIGSKFATTVISNNKVRVADGVMCVGGHMGRTAYGDYNDMTIENGVSGKNRNDIIYAKFLTSGSADTFTLEVKKGTATTGTAEDPALTQGVLYENATLREFPLWRVKLEGLSIVAVEQMFTLVPTIPELEAKFNELNNSLGTLRQNNLDTRIIINEYNSLTNMFVAPRDGYVSLSFSGVKGSYKLQVAIYGANSKNYVHFGVITDTSTYASYFSNSIFVKKGMKIHVVVNDTNGNGNACFCPLID